MLEILDIGVAMPDRIQNIHEASDELLLSSKDRRMYARFFGLETFPRDAGQTLHAMTDEACLALGEAIPFTKDDLDMVMYCHTLMSVVPIHQDVTVPFADFATDQNEAFSLTMNHCATAVSAFEALDLLLPPDGTALLLISDKGFHRILREIPNTTIMGESAVAILLGRRPGKFRYLATHTERLGKYSVMSGLVGAVEAEGFAKEYVGFVTECIQQALIRADLTIDEVKLILPHNVNLPSWDQIGDACGVTKDQIYLENVPRFGHMFNADPFLNLMDAAKDGRLKNGDTVLMVSVGLGATASCSALQVTGLDSPTPQKNVVKEKACV
ncbi:MAG: 3-oxoacyl-[acyl-carrier-protein] synthase III C-terminal domain-containing protein [Aliishimia sp.]